MQQPSPQASLKENGNVLNTVLSVFEKGRHNSHIHFIKELLVKTAEGIRLFGLKRTNANPHFQLVIHIFQTFSRSFCNPDAHRGVPCPHLSCHAHPDVVVIFMTMSKVKSLA